MKKKFFSFFYQLTNALFPAVFKKNLAVVSYHIDLIKNSIIDKYPQNLIKYGNSVYSQNEEDGILYEIFIRLGCQKVKFIEFGVHDTENNSLSILINGGQGVWVDKGLANLKPQLNGT